MSAPFPSVRSGHAWVEFLRVFAVVVLATALEVHAAPAVSGAPRYSTDRLGAAVSDFGSAFAIKADVTSASADRLGAFSFYDVRPGAVRDLPLGTFSLRFTDAQAQQRFTSRAIAFEPWGWTESSVDGSAHADVHVFTLEHDVFAIVVDLTGTTGPINIEARIEGALTATNATATAQPDGTIVVDNAEGRPFALAWSPDPLTAADLASSGSSYASSMTVTEDSPGTLAYVIAFDSTAAAALTRRDGAVTRHGAPASWAAAISTDWQTYLAATNGTVTRTNPPELDVVEARARTLLRMNALTDDAGTKLGGYPAKTHYDHFWVWDSAFQALGVSELDPASARAELDAILRGELTSGDDSGMLPNHVDDKGVAPPVGVPGYADLYSQAPALGMAIRPVYERSPQDDAARAWLQRSYDASGRFIDWWFRRRDSDGDGLPEVNGGWEDGADNSPRFTELWGDSIVARLPALDSDKRPRLNAVDIAAFLYVYEDEQARVAELLGHADEAATWRTRASDLAQKIEGDGSFWDASRNGYFDFARGSSGKQRFIQTKTPVMWFPLFAGTTKDPERVKALVATITDPKQFWGDAGIPSVAFDDPSFDPHDYWRGPIWLNYGYMTCVALYRYGYDAEAAQLRDRLLQTAARGDAIWEYYDAKTGEGINAAQFGWSGGLALELLRDRYQADAFDVTEADPATVREGFIQRLRRLSDGAELARVNVAGSSALPKTHFSSDAALFTGSPVEITFEDPTGRLGDVDLTLPTLEQARVEIDGAASTMSAPITLHVAKTSTIRISEYRFVGDKAQGCGCTTGQPFGGLASAIIALGFALRRARVRSAPRKAS